MMADLPDDLTEECVKKANELCTQRLSRAEQQAIRVGASLMFSFLSNRGYIDPYPDAAMQPHSVEK